MGQLSLPLYADYAVAQDGRGQFRVYDNRQADWADQAEDATPERGEAERLAAAYAAVDTFLASADVPEGARAVVRWDEEDPQFFPECCWGCGEVIADGAAVLYITVDADPGNAEVGPDPNICAVPVHLLRCLARYVARTGIAIDRMVARDE